MTMGHTNANGRNRLLGVLPPVDFTMLFPHLREMHFKQGTLLQEADEPVEMVYFPHTGMISLLAVMESGEGVETATIGREGAVNTMTGRGGRASGRAVVQVEGTSSQILASRFHGAMDDSPFIRMLIVRYNEAQISAVYQSVGCNAIHRVEARLCRWLLQTMDRTESAVLALTQELLSEMLGVQRTTVTVLARQIQDAGLIRYRRGRIEVLDRNGLEKRACACYKRIQTRMESIFS
jgi:CRP-like cAMP-binding protein